MENSKYNHLMLDMETLGDESRSVIVSIAAVCFDISTGTTGPHFYQKIDIQTSLDAGLQVTGSTLAWWLQQPSVYSKEWLSNALPFEQVLLMMYNHLLANGSMDKNTFIWSRGRRFDIGLLADAFAIAGYQIPWYHSNERDVRTLESLRPKLKEQIEFVGQRHHALDDCYYQIKYCSAIWQEIEPYK